MALAVDQLPLGQIGTNCYLVRASREATDAVVIDPGAEASEEAAVMSPIMDCGQLVGSRTPSMM